MHSPQHATPIEAGRPILRLQPRANQWSYHKVIWQSGSSNKNRFPYLFSETLFRVFFPQSRRTGPCAATCVTSASPGGGLFVTNLGKVFNVKTSWYSLDLKNKLGCSSAWQNRRLSGLFLAFAVCSPESCDSGVKLSTWNRLHTHYLLALSLLIHSSIKRPRRRPRRITTHAGQSQCLTV